MAVPIVDVAVSGQRVYSNTPGAWQDYGGMWHNVVPVFQYDPFSGEKTNTDISPAAWSKGVEYISTTETEKKTNLIPLLLIGAAALFLTGGKLP